MDEVSWQQICLEQEADIIFQCMNLSFRLTPEKMKHTPHATLSTATPLSATNGSKALNSLLGSHQNHFCSRSVHTVVYKTAKETPKEHLGIDADRSAELTNHTWFIASCCQKWKQLISLTFSFCFIAHGPKAAAAAAQECPASHHTSSGKSSHLHTSKQNKTLMFFVYSSPVEKTPSCSATLAVQKSHNLPFYVTASGTFHTPVFIPVALGLCNTYPHPRSSFIFLLCTMHYKDIVSQAISSNILVTEGMNSAWLKNTCGDLPLLSY